MSKTLLEIMEPVLTEVKRECKEEGRQEGRQEGMVYAYYEMNLSTNEIAKKVQLDENEVLEILRHRDSNQKD